ncbi:MAG: DUF6691 family protein [Armatimonadota bacterium]
MSDGLRSLHGNHRRQLWLGLLLGVIFGFLLHKGGVTDYNVLLAQLLLQDFTVIKVMLSAIIVGMIGVHLLRSLGLVQLHPKPGSVGTVVIGGLLFGVAFGLLGYCPGTGLAAAAHGTLDALAGVAGMILGAGLFAWLYPWLLPRVLQRGDFGELTLPQLLRASPWAVIVPLALLLTGLLYWLKKANL